MIIPKIKMNYSFELPTGFKKEDLEKVTDSKEAFWACYSAFQNLELFEYKEYFVAVFLNNANKVIGWQLVSEGGINCTIVDIRVLFSAALLVGASKIIVAHNHPSGDKKPSVHDIELTKRIVEAGKILNITILDHIIITDMKNYDYYTFFVNDLM
jgi:DNA repair protein RadC